MEEAALTVVYDYLIVGCGFYGSVWARQMTDAGAKCLIIDKRKHIGGNAYTEKRDGVPIHCYGAHIFHTNSKLVWNYMNRYTDFNGYVHRVCTMHHGKVYQMPINMSVFHALWGVVTPEQAQEKLEQVRVKIDNPSNAEEWLLCNVGEQLYSMFFKEYTTKQWGKSPRDLPSNIVQRLPLRFTYDGNYFSDKYQGIPVDGYTPIFEKLLHDIPIELDVDFLKDREHLETLAKKIVYTGGIDALHNYKYGALEWRSLDFKHEQVATSNHQGVAVMNYPELSVPYTRIIEHQHFHLHSGSSNTTITKEYPKTWKIGEEPYYPINDEKNAALHAKYRQESDSRYLFGGRLADYKYYDMHHVIGSALARSDKEIEVSK